MKKYLLSLILTLISTILFATKQESVIGQLYVGMPIDRVIDVCGEPTYSKLEKETNTRMLLYSFYKSGGGLIEYHMYIQDGALNSVMKFIDNAEESVVINSEDEFYEKQGGFLTKGVYQKKEVIKVDSVSATELYLRALETMSDWVGSSKLSKAGIDIQDKDQGLVVFKGLLYLGYGKQNFMYGWNTYANFTLKVRCKDERVQISITVPSLTYCWTANSSEVTVPIHEVWPEFNYKGDMLIKRASLELGPKIPQACDDAIRHVANHISISDEDDF